MKEKTKKIIEGFIETAGYTGAIAYSSILTWLLLKIHKYGKISISEPNIYTLLGEIGFGSGTILFLCYEFLKKLKKRGKEIEKL